MIYPLDNNPYKAAKYQTDRDVVNGVQFVAQVLSTVVRTNEDWLTQYLSLEKDDPRVLFPVSYRDHPFVQWGSSAVYNLAWMINHGIGLSNEFYQRYNRQHPSKTVFFQLAKTFTAFLGYHDLHHPFPLLMPDAYKDHHDTVASYQKFYVAERIKGERWGRLAKQLTPQWLLRSVAYKDGKATA